MIFYYLYIFIIKVFVIDIFSSESCLTFACLLQ